MLRHILGYLVGMLGRIDRFNENDIDINCIGGHKNGDTVGKVLFNHCCIPFSSILLMSIHLTLRDCYYKGSIYLKSYFS